MKSTARSEAWFRLLLVLLLLLPIAVLFLKPGGGFLAGGLLFWVVLLICFWLIAMMLGTPQAAAQAEARSLRTVADEERPEIIRDVMTVNVATQDPEGVRLFRGQLREPADAAFARLKRGVPAGTVPLLQDDEETGAAIILMPKPVEEAKFERPARPWVHWLLLALTVLTTTWAGAAHAGVDLLREPARFAVGLPYSLGLLLILGVHELGHYFMARRHGISVTPPYFIPVPLALGTFGAFIKMRSPVENRRALFDVAVAGPLAGLAVAIPALLVGLQSSTLVPGDDAGGGMMGGTSVGSSLLFALLAKLSLGPALEYGHVLQLSPLAFAGWLGLLVTALNLLPIGQLDGGHMARAMFGRRVGTTISSIAMWSLLLLAIFVWPGLTMWAILVFFLAGTTAPPLNDVTPLTARQRWLGYATFAILALILMPLPHRLWSAVGLHCPYV